MPKNYKRIHTVKEGESFLTLSRDNKVKGSEILELNRDQGQTKWNLAYPQREPPWGVSAGDKVLIPYTEKEKKERKRKEKAKEEKKEKVLNVLNENNYSADQIDLLGIGSTAECVLCLIHELSVTCSHDKRNYTHRENTTIGSVFHVIGAGSTKGILKLPGSVKPKQNYDEIKVRFDEKGCNQGKNIIECGYVELTYWSDGETRVKALHSGDSFKAYPSSDSFRLADDDFPEFMRNFLIPNKLYESYTLSSKCCDLNGTPLIVVRCYTPIKYSGTISLGYKHRAYKQSNFHRHDYYANLVKQGTWTVTGGLKIESGDSVATIGAPTGKVDADRNKKLAKSLFKNAQKVLDTITPLLNGVKSDYAEAKVLWPNLRLGGSVYNTELVESPEVGLGGNFSVGFYPLIGANFTFNILNILIGIALTSITGNPSIGKYLVNLKERLSNEKNRVRVNLSLKFTVGAEIKGGINFTFNPNQRNTVDGKIIGAIPMHLKGNADIDLDMVFVSAGAGVEIGAITEFRTTLEGKKTFGDDIEFDGFVSFEGFVIYYMYHVRVGGRKNDPSKPDSKPVNEEELRAKLRNVNPEHVFEVCAPRRYPPKGEAIMINDEQSGL